MQRITAEAPEFYHATSGLPLAKQLFHVQGLQLKTRDIRTFQPND